MRKQNSVERQVTFNTELVESDVLSDIDLRRGSIHIPVVRDSDVKFVTKGVILSPVDNTLDPTGPAKLAPSLALSIRRKLKKKPRHRVPSLHFIAQEPSIKEETTQDLLSPSSASVSSIETTHRIVRTNTVILDSTTYKNNPLKLAPKESPQKSTRRRNEVTIVEFPKAGKSQQVTPSVSRKNPEKNNQESTAKHWKYNHEETLLTEITTNTFSAGVADLTNTYTKSHKEKLFNPQNSNTNNSATELEKKYKSQIQPIQFTSMAKPRLHGYEHETFEEILQDRNSLVQSEKTYNKRIRQLEDELKAIVLQCQALSDENKELRKMLDNVKQENPADKKKMEALLLENSNLTSQKNELEKKIHSLDKQLTLKTKNENFILTLESKNQELEFKVAELHKENNSLKAKVVSLEDTNQIISTKLEEKRKEFLEMMKTMKNESVLDVRLKESNHNLAEAEREIAKLKETLSETTQNFKSLKITKETLKSELSEKDNQLEGLRLDHEKDLRIITDLKTDLERSAHELRNYESKKSDLKDLQKESAMLKTKVSSVKSELELTAAETTRLKQERVEMSEEIDRLRDICSKNTDSAAESKKFFKKWEAEKEARINAETEVSQKDKEARNIERRLRDSEQTIRELHKKIQALEEENEKLGSLNTQEFDTDNKTLKEENKKLRQILVERNIELANKICEHKNEQGEGQILYLERKSKFAKVGVQNVPGWSVSSNKGHYKRQGHSVTFSSDMLLPNGRNKGPNVRHPEEGGIKSQSADTSPRAGRNNVRTSAWTEMSAVMEEETKKSNTTLPHIDTNNDTVSEHPAGYFNLYKEKLKRRKDKRY